MVSKQDLIRNKLDEKVFPIMGKTVTLISKSAPVYDERGEIVNGTDSSESITIVPYNVFDNRQSFNQVGTIKEGEMECVFRYDQVVNVDDVVVMEGIRYEVKTVNPNYLPGNVATICVLMKEQTKEL